MFSQAFKKVTVCTGGLPENLNTPKFQMEGQHLQNCLGRLDFVFRGLLPVKYELFVRHE